ncbi:DUF4334 domain-containing protein [Rhodococcus daqingensis]|uniref:DUF4334 domain-containing protein n=1 Tax=Rhodococcus daqingensis TaxID=2479363 RepID=A0ABW2S2I9_9NOCA
MTGQQKFFELLGSEGPVDPRRLDEVWAALPTVHIDELKGRWRGSGFETGHRTGRLLAKSGWYGKNFGSRFDVQPMLCRGTDGELFSDVAAGKGEASLWMVEFRGECTATMVYDGMPVFDHFKRVDDQTLMGIMNGKAVLDGGEHFYFALMRDETD